jgi:ABC-type multidrug transport system ATPase subunit
MKLRLRQLWKSLGRQPLLRSLDLDCADGETICLLGENGTGKSTLLATIAGVISADAGTISIEEADGRVADDRRFHIGYLPENPNPMPWLGVAEWLSVVASLRSSEPPAPELLAALDLSPVLHHRLDALSLGQRRRVHIAAALVGDPWILVADEPTNGLDVQGVPALFHLLEARRRNGRAALIATHDRVFADKVSTRHVRLESGRLTAIDSCTSDT